MSRFTGRTLVRHRQLICVTILLLQVGYRVTLKHAGLFLPGTASVIIALTDGELLEDQLITAQQEVYTNFLNCHSFSLNNTPWWSVSFLEVIDLFLISSNRQKEPGPLELSCTVLVSKTLMKHR